MNKMILYIPYSEELKNTRDLWQSNKSKIQVFDKNDLQEYPLYKIERLKYNHSLVYLNEDNFSKYIVKAKNGELLFEDLLFVLDRIRECKMDTNKYIDYIAKESKDIMREYRIFCIQLFLLRFFSLGYFPRNKKLKVIINHIKTRIIPFYKRLSIIINKLIKEENYEYYVPY